MRRRTLLRGASVGLFALIAAGTGVYTQVPIVPRRPDPDADTALGWITFRDGRFALTVPRAEMGQNIATAMKQIAAAELDVPLDRIDAVLHDTTISPVRATVGSESIMHFAEPLAQACAAMRDAIANGQDTGQVQVTSRPYGELKAFRVGAAVGVLAQLVQGTEIVTGEPLFAADIRWPGQLFGRVLRAPASVEVNSNPLHWNESAARAVPGFVAVTTAVGPPIGKAQGLGIIAQRPGALDAIEAALEIEWTIDGSASSDDIEATIDIDRRLAQGPLPKTVMDGNPTDGSWDVDLRFDLPAMAHAPIEPRAAVANWVGGSLKVWAGTQDAFYVRDVLSDVFGVGRDKVVVQSARIGGAFGGKTICTVETEASALAKAAKAPVKVQWTRAQEFALAFHRPPSSHRVKARLSQGQLTDWQHDQVSSHILFTSAVAPQWMQRGTDLVIGDPGVGRGMKVPYTITRKRASYQALRLPIHTGPWRGLGAGPNGLAVESAIDEAALAIGEDPVAFRLRHIENERLAGVVKRVAEVANWANRPLSTGSRKGRGIACGIYKGSSYAAVVADVELSREGDIRITHLWCVHDCGIVINPDQVRAQCEGNLVWSLGLVISDNMPIAEGRPDAEDFADTPIPRFQDVPPITVDLIPSEAAPSGAGETAMVAAPGAIANAIRNAAGLRPTRFPIDPKEFAL